MKRSQTISSTIEQQRGILIHRLFEILGNSYFLKDQNDCKLAAQRWCAKNDLKNTISDTSIEKIFSILADANYQHFFGPSSVGEVEVLYGNFKGRIDRLSVVESKVYILDYKTGAPPREKNSKTNCVYSLQLKNYREALKALYPDHFVHTFLLWIEGPYLLEVYYYLEQ